MRRLICLVGMEICFCAGFGWAQQPQKTIVVNDSITVRLPDVFVEGERPLVKVSEGKLLFDVPHLIRNRPVTNALEVLGELPGVEKNGDRVSITGSISTHLLINGRKSSMTLEQLTEMLKSTSANQVKSVEVMYSAPPQSGVRGGAINVVLENDRSLKDYLKGEMALTGRQAHYTSPSGLLNLAYIGKQYALNFSYSGEYRHSYSKEEMEAYPIIDEVPYTVLQTSRSEGKSWTHNLRGALDFSLKNKDAFSVSYTGNYKRPHPGSDREASTDFVDIQQAETQSHLSGSSDLHNVHIDYQGHTGWMAGADYTYYRDRTLQDLYNKYSVQSEQHLFSNSWQQVQRGNLFINNKSRLPRQWVLNYGVDASLSSINNTSDTQENEQVDPAATFRLKQREYALEGFVGVSKQWGKKITLNASLAVRYYKADADSLGHTSTLWKKTDVYPNLTFIYKLNPAHLLQLSFSSERKYPAYWTITPSSLYMNAYSVVKGNPNLQPEKMYSARLNYILKSKYVFGVFTNLQPDYMRQMSYLCQDRLQAIYQTFNFDVHTVYGFMAVIPFKAGQILNSRLTLTGFNIHDKGTLFDLSFNQKQWFGRAMLTNTFYLLKSRNLSFDLSGWYNTKSIQGIYTIDPMFDLSAALVWNFMKGKARLTFRAEDLLNGRNPVTHVNNPGQTSRMELFQDLRHVSLTFSYRFGGYKEKKFKEVDTSRLGN